MILFPVYAISVWVAIGALRRSWLGLAVASLSFIPVLVLSYLCIQFIPLKPGEPRPEWLYIITGAYAVVVTGVGLAIALAGHGPRPSDCHQCRYDMRGVQSVHCPECGASRRCDACHAPLALAERGRCIRCHLPVTQLPPPPPALTPLPAHAPRSAPQRIRSRRAALRRLAAPRT